MGEAKGFFNPSASAAMCGWLNARCLRLRLREDGSGSAYDKESMAIIKLNNTTVLYLKEVTKFLALVCILREESFERKGETATFLSWASPPPTSSASDL